MSGDVALVTGAGNGLGEHIAKALHAAGFRVAVSDIDAAAAQRVATALSADGATAMALRLDVAAEQDFIDALDALRARWGQANVLVNNAALTQAQPVLDITSEEFSKVLGVNVVGTFNGCRVFGRYFKQEGYGRIVNMASLAGQNGGTATGAHYATSKGAIISLTKVFARDLAPFGVTANAIAPGPLDTPAVHALVGENMPTMLKNIPVGTLGHPSFIADMIARICARDAGFITGATLDINGGLYLR